MSGGPAWDPAEVGGWVGGVQGVVTVHDGQSADVVWVCGPAGCVWL
jgi:hypothetical protein